MTLENELIIRQPYDAATLLRRLTP